MKAQDRQLKVLEECDKATAREQAIQRCKCELATNFDCPSEQILGIYGAQIGLSSREMFDLLASRI
jgi:hypothetical protein